MDIRDLLSAPRVSELLEHVPYDEYHQIAALRSGVIKDGLSFTDAERQPVISPRHIRASYESELSKDSESMLFGRALHCLLLTPGEFVDNYCYYEGRRDERTKAYQEFLAENSGKEILKASGPMSWDWCMQAAQEFVANDVVQNYIAAGSSEVTGLATICDVPCKVRYDWLSISEHCILDVKTTRSVGPLEFWYEARRYGYGIQLAMYQHVYELISGQKLPVVIAAVENHPPFVSVVYSVPDELLERDLMLVKRVCERVRECLEADDWPAFATGVTPLAVPDWEMEEIDFVDWSEA